MFRYAFPEVRVGQPNLGADSWWMSQLAGIAFVIGPATHLDSTHTSTRRCRYDA